LSPLLTPWSYSLYSSLPDFFKKELLFEREVAGSLKLSQIETERLISYLVGEELAKRKKAGTYTGSFAPVTHFFGYQGRSAHPSHFDCSLGSTCGYAAARLVAAGVTGMCVSVKGVTQPAEQWRVGAVPIISLLASHPKQGFKRSKLVVRSENVDLESAAFQEYKAQHRQWRSDDEYKNPGPIQFTHNDQLDRECSDTFGHMFASTDNLTAEITGLCNSIQNDVLFSEHQHLLVAALSSLKSAKQVINVLSQTRA
jgi:hypothetical protein